MRTIVVLCDTGALVEDKISDFDGTEVGKYARRAANEASRRNRLATFLLARGALKAYGFELTDIIHGKCCEPHLVIAGAESELFFSASHSEGVTAIIISERPVGIDVEGEISHGRKVTLEKRFLTGRGIESVACIEPVADLLIARLDECGEIFVTESIRLDGKHGKNAVYVNNNIQIHGIDPCSEVTAKWCTLEALIKSTGGGFADFLNTGTIAAASNIATYRITSGGDRLYMAIAEMRGDKEN